MSAEAHRPCLQCEYDLTGLSERGYCPECGNAYNLRTGQGVVTERVSSHRRGDRIMARVRTVVLLVSVVVVMGCGGLLSWLVDQTGGNWLKPLAMAGLVSVVLLMGAALSYLNQREL